MSSFDLDKLRTDVLNVLGVLDLWAEPQGLDAELLQRLANVLPDVQRGLCEAEQAADALAAELSPRLPAADSQPARLATDRYLEALADLPIYLRDRAYLNAGGRARLVAMLSLVRSDSDAILGDLEREEGEVVRQPNSTCREERTSATTAEPPRVCPFEKCDSHATGPREWVRCDWDQDAPFEAGKVVLCTCCERHRKSCMPARVFHGVPEGSVLLVDSSGGAAKFQTWREKLDASRGEAGT